MMFVYRRTCHHGGCVMNSATAHEGNIAFVCRRSAGGTASWVDERDTRRVSGSGQRRSPCRQMWHRSTRRVCLALTGCAAALVPTVADGQTVSHQTIAVTGQQAAGAPAGVQYGTLIIDPWVNDAGQVSFGGYLRGPG